MTVLFQEAKIGNMTLKNRFVRSATRELLASDDGRVTDRYLKIYNRLAEGGVALIIPGGYYVQAIGSPSPRIITVDKDEVIDDLKKVVDVVHKNGAKIIAQLNHAGRQSDPKVIGTRPLAPSPVREKHSFIKPRAMKECEIEETIMAFGEAARRVREAGFDGIQIHAAHGYLVNQFLSGYTNRRSDKWGGPLENRMRLLLEIYKLTRSIAGDDYPVITKINCEDFVRKGVRIEETIEVCKRLDKLGIDAIEVSGGIGENGLVTLKGDIPMDLVMLNRNFFQRFAVRLILKSLTQQARFYEAYFLPQAAAIKKEVKAPVIAVGGMRNSASMENAVLTGQTDFISMCRPFIRTPNLVNKIRNGDENPITCTNCNRCSLKVITHQYPLGCYNIDSAAKEKSK